MRRQAKRKGGSPRGEEARGAADVRSRPAAVAVRPSRRGARFGVDGTCAYERLEDHDEPRKPRPLSLFTSRTGQRGESEKLY